MYFFTDFSILLDLVHVCPKAAGNESEIATRWTTHSGGVLRHKGDPTRSTLEENAVGILLPGV